jgi:hypothetical protein
MNSPIWRPIKLKSWTISSSSGWPSRLKNSTTPRHRSAAVMGTPNAARIPSFSASCARG